MNQYYSHTGMIAAIRNGGEEAKKALEFLYKERGKKGIRDGLTGWVLNNGGSQDQANEILHQVIIVFWERIRRDAKFTVSNFQGYLMQTGKYLFWEEVRNSSPSSSEKAKPQPPDPGWEKNFQQMQRENDHIDAFLDILKRLEENCQTLLKLKYAYSFTLQKIKERLELDISVQGVRDRVLRCRGHLKKMFTDNPLLYDRIIE